ncbi:MAG: hypothetical protein QXD03_02135 [Candidatus Anstonellales archaeon]
MMVFRIKSILSDEEIKYIIYSLSLFPYRDVSHLISKIVDDGDLSDLELSNILEKLTFMPYRDVKDIINKISMAIRNMA